MAVFAPMPSTNARITMKVIPGVLSNIRAPYRRSWMKVVIVHSSLWALVQEPLFEIGHLQNLSGREGWFTPAPSFSSSNLSSTGRGQAALPNLRDYSCCKFPFIDFFSKVYSYRKACNGSTLVARLAGM